MIIKTKTKKRGWQIFVNSICSNGSKPEDSNKYSYGKIKCENGIHGDSVDWFGNNYRCEKCGMIFNYNILANNDYGEDCPKCKAVLMPIPWALDRYFSLRPACELCTSNNKKNGNEGINKGYLLTFLKIIKKRFVS